MVINFEKDKKVIKVTVEDKECKLPSTLIRCETESNEEILKTCQNWLDALGLTETEYKVSVRIH